MKTLEYAKEHFDEFEETEPCEAVTEISLPDCEDACIMIVNELKDFLGDAYTEITRGRREFRDWLERMRWHVKKCDELERELQSIKEKEPCEDAVSLDEILKLHRHIEYDFQGYPIDEYVSVSDIKNLPSVVPRNTGKSHTTWDLGRDCSDGLGIFDLFCSE